MDKGETNDLTMTNYENITITIVLISQLYTIDLTYLDTIKGDCRNVKPFVIYNLIDNQ
jgi:hypothetical protein